MKAVWASAAALSVLSAFATANVGAQQSEHPTPVTPVATTTAPGGSVDSMFVPILVYHSVMPHHPGQTAMQIAYDVAPEAFESQMAYLRDNKFTVVSFATLIDAINTGKRLPDKSVVISFDDGRENQYVHAFPVLKKFGYTATFFIYPNPIGRKDDFMTWDQVRELQKAGMTIGNHTYTHPYLTKVADPKDFKREIEGSRTAIEKQIGQPVEFFAYPFGLKNDSVVAAVTKAGYKAARGFPGGTWQGKRNLYTLKGLQIGDSMKGFAKMVNLPAPAPVRAAPAHPVPPAKSAKSAKSIRP